MFKSAISCRHESSLKDCLEYLEDTVILSVACIIIADTNSHYLFPSDALWHHRNPLDQVMAWCMLTTEAILTYRQWDTDEETGA